MKSFNIIHHDGVIKVRIDEDGHTIIEVEGINDKEVVIRAINRAFREGARFGTLFTGEVVNDKLASRYLAHAEKETTVLGGRVTQLADGLDGPTFRVDWAIFPRITE